VIRGLARAHSTGTGTGTATRAGVSLAAVPPPCPGPAADTELLRVTGLTKAFRTEAGMVRAIRGVDLTLCRGQFVAIMGPSGSGKSTLLHLLAGLEPVTSGEIWLGGERVDGVSQARWALLRRRHIGVVFQFYNLVSTMTVADNIELPALLAGATRRQAASRREALLADLGLASKAQASPGRLSGGEQQRVALARALAHQPSLLLADEPTGHLDSANAADVARLLGRAHAQGQSILLVTHNARIASGADRVINLFDGMVADDAVLPRRPRSSPSVPGMLNLWG
jgi:putative ABC transport system ATP-binding protein